MAKIKTRKSGNRLKGYDYSIANYYYITTCTENRREWFGRIYNNEMTLNCYGEICQEKLLGLPNISLSKIMRDFKSFSCREINKTICRDKSKPCPILFKWQLW